ncbi:MAG: hypothetical protein AABY22_13530 [Nanoarchaeota archaeon]
MKIRDYIIKKLGGFTQEEMKGLEVSVEKRVKEEARSMIERNIKVSLRGDFDDLPSYEKTWLNVLSAFIDYICVRIGIRPIYNNGSYESLKDYFDNNENNTTKRE